MLWKAEEAAKDADAAEKLAASVSGDSRTAQASMWKAGRDAEQAARAAQQEDDVITQRAHTQLQDDSEQSRLLAEASLDADMVDWERQRGRAERQQARGYRAEDGTGDGTQYAQMAAHKSHQAHEATQLELNDIDKAQDALDQMQSPDAPAPPLPHHVAEKPLVNPYAMTEDPRDAQRCMQECSKDCADECELEAKSRPGVPCSLDCRAECLGMCPGGADFVHGTAHNPPAMDHSRSQETVPSRVNRHDGMIPDTYSNDQEVSDGRPGPVIEKQEPYRWTQDIDEDPAEPADGSGKEVQPETPMVGRVMDKTCIDQCLPKCEAECPMKGGDQEVCNQECTLKCEDDCYIDEAGGPPSPSNISPPPPQYRPATSTGDPFMDAKIGRGGQSGEEDQAGPQSEMEAQAEHLMTSCVSTCMGPCASRCLSDQGLGWLPSPLTEQHVKAMKTQMDPTDYDTAVKGHAACEDTCLDKCFPKCEQSVASKIQRKFGSGEAATDQEGAAGFEGGGNGFDGGGMNPGGRGQGRYQQSAQRYPQDMDANGNVIIPAEMPPSPFASSTWHWALITAAAIACTVWLMRSGRICKRKGRAVGMSNF